MSAGGSTSLAVSAASWVLGLVSGLEELSVLTLWLGEEMKHPEASSVQAGMGRRRWGGSTGLQDGGGGGGGETSPSSQL